MIIECVPNFSEGRRKEVTDKIRAAVESRGGRVLDLEMDANHNRAVLTFIGTTADQLVDAAFAGAQAAVELIDLNKHQGEHPRMGAVDVIPFVPIADATMAQCVDLARRLGQRIGDELGVPVFLYEEAATRPERKNLSNVREGQFEGLRELIGKDPARDPDFGPKRIHPTAGAVAVGARVPLIAYNVNLETEDVSIAKKIAKKVRERDGGLPTIKALGMFMESIKKAQVSMNVCNFKVTSIHTAFKAVEKEAEKFGVKVHSSEVVGLLPKEALKDEWISELKLHGFDPKLQVIENRL